MKKSKLIINLVQNDKPLSQILYSLKLLLFDIADNKILEWINKEINGYSDNDEIPEYRCIRGCIECDILHGYQYYQRVNLPVIYSDPKIQEIITLNCKESVAAIETMMKKEEGQFFSVIPSHAYQYLQKYVDGYVQNAKLILSSHDFLNIYAAIKNTVLDILLILEQKFGNLDSYDLDFKDLKKEEIVPIILKIIYQDNSITIGSNNKISKSKISTS